MEKSNDMSSLSTYQKSLVRDAMTLLARAIYNIDFALNSDAVDDLEDAQSLAFERRNINDTITNLKKLVNE